ncbi:Ig-like domain-containing protein [bacterium]|nr:Ig-like domain-containing protein [bacterium]
MVFCPRGNGRFPLAVIALFVFIGFSCAKQGLPPGGPEDKIPPELIGSSPANMSINVSAGERILFEFSEPMDSKSVEDNFFVVPIPSSWPEFLWHSGSRALEVRFHEPFKMNTTYVVSIGAKASDLRRNPLDDTVTLTFSTGATIENGKITGRIIPYGYFSKEPEKISGVDIVAYRLSDAGKSPDPRSDVPDYFTQSGNDGSFEITGLSHGLYRIFAIGDKDGNGFYSEGSDMVGIAPHDVELAEKDSVRAPMIMVSSKDTTGVQLRSVRASDSRRVEVFFDRAVVSAGMQLAFDGLEIDGFFVDVKNPQTVSVATAAQENGKRYAVSTLEVFDRDGNGVAPLGFKPDFAGTDRPDTTALEIADWGPKILTAGSGPLRLVFNRILAISADSDTSFALADESGEDLAVRRSAPNEMEITPPNGWKEGYNYLISLEKENLKGISGNTFADTAGDIRFRVVPSDTLGFMIGSVVDPAGGDGSLYRIAWKHIETGTVSEIGIRGPVEWASGGVLPGRYIAYAYRDDGDSTVFRGMVSPFRAAEQVVAYPDTIKVVSRWKTDTIQFIFE